MGTYVINEKKTRQEHTTLGNQRHLLPINYRAQKLKVDKFDYNATLLQN